MGVDRGHAGPNQRPLRVAHIITSLDPHGAQGMLLRLAVSMEGARYSSHVFSLTGPGDVGDSLLDAGIPVTTVQLKGNIHIFSELLKLARSIHAFRPDIVQTWMYHADLIGGLIGKFLGIKNVFWNVRHSDVDEKEMRWLTKSIARVCAILSHVLPRAVICNSRRAIAIHEQIGYRKDGFLLIPNGFDVGVFKSYPDAGNALRSLLGLKEADFLVGVAARFHPQKDHHGLIQSAALVCAKASNVHFVLCGTGVDQYNLQLSSWIDEFGVRKNFHLLGFRPDVNRITAGFDVALLPSAYGEGFSNALGEAMASGIPCVTTDVGDSAWIVNDTGAVVPPSNPEVLAAAIMEMVTRPKEELHRLGTKARKRIETQFSLDAIVLLYQKAYETVAI